MHIVKTGLAGADASGKDSSGQSGQSGAGKSGEGQGVQPVQSETGQDGVSQEGNGVPGEPGMTQPAAVALAKPTLPVVQYDVAPGSKLAALTFDDGPDARYTPGYIGEIQG
jgi:hypothetical protein